jgi:hypothetical protein
MTLERDADVEATVLEVAARLTRRFSEADAATVEQVVRGCADRFAGARVRGFVPTLVERGSVRALAALTSSGRPTTSDREGVAP